MIKVCNSPRYSSGFNLDHVSGYITNTPKFIKSLPGRACGTVYLKHYGNGYKYVAAINITTSKYKTSLFHPGNTLSAIISYRQIKHFKIY